LLMPMARICSFGLALSAAPVNVTVARAGGEASQTFLDQVRPAWRFITGKPGLLRGRARGLRAERGHSPGLTACNTGRPANRRLAPDDAFEVAEGRSSKSSASIVYHWSNARSTTVNPPLLAGCRTSDREIAPRLDARRPFIVIPASG